MSLALYNEISGLRFWTEKEILMRDTTTTLASNTVKSTLSKLNPAWSFHRVEGPLLTPQSFISPEYTDEDVFSVDFDKAGEPLKLRAETTRSSYEYARYLMSKSNEPKPLKLPLCVWQSGKSFRKEGQGQRASRLRFFEFYQLEFQCIYSKNTGADYLLPVIQTLRNEIGRLTSLETRIVESDRLPSYSLETWDIEVLQKDGEWREMASCSRRNDFSDETLVAEFALGLDRIATLAAQL